MGGEPAGDVCYAKLVSLRLPTLHRLRVVGLDTLCSRPAFSLEDPVLQGLDALRSRPAFSLEDHCPPRIGHAVLSPSVQS